jgi:hypothetical protein
MHMNIARLLRAVEIQPASEFNASIHQLESFVTCAAKAGVPVPEVATLGAQP